MTQSPSNVGQQSVDPQAARSFSTGGLFVLSQYPTAGEAQVQLNKMSHECARADNVQAINSFFAVVLGENEKNDRWLRVSSLCVFDSTLSTDLHHFGCLLA